MAVTFRSVGVSPGAVSTTCVIAKPAGLAVDDLMIAQITSRDEGTAVTPPENWTEIRQDANGNVRSGLFWKMAIQTDVDASDFTFTVGNAATLGAITAWIGHNALSPINANNGQANAQSYTVTSPEITPSVADCMILMFAAPDDDNTHSDYAIVVSNPASWDERYDIQYNGPTSSDCSIAMGSAIRPETTATGNGTAASSGIDVNVGQLVAITPETVSGDIDTPAKRRMAAGIIPFHSVIIPDGTIGLKDRMQIACLYSENAVATPEVGVPTHFIYYQRMRRA